MASHGHFHRSNQIRLERKPKQQPRPLLILNHMNSYIKVEVKTDGELYLFSIQREPDGELTITSQKNLPEKIQNLIDDLWTGHAPSSI
jgi:hypothetical protein